MQHMENTKEDISKLAVVLRKNMLTCILLAIATSVRGNVETTRKRSSSTRLRGKSESKRVGDDYEDILSLKEQATPGRRAQLVGVSKKRANVDTVLVVNEFDEVLFLFRCIGAFFALTISPSLIMSCFLCFLGMGVLHNSGYVGADRQFGLG